MVVDLIGALLIIVTAILADKASEKWKKWCWALFVLLVCAQTWLQVRTKKLDETKNDNQENEIKGQHADIQNLIGELHKSEIQRQVDNAILRTKLEDYSQLAQLGPALMKLAETSAEFQKKQYDTKATNDKELYRLAMSSVAKIRDFSKKILRSNSPKFSSFRSRRLVEAFRC